MTLEQLIEQRAAEAIAEIEGMADAARIELGMKAETVHRRRGQLRRFRKVKEGAKHE